MGFYDRLFRTEQPTISVHPFMAALGELERGKMTRAQVISAFSIQPAEEAAFDALVARVVPVPESISLGATVVLTNVGASYDAIPASKGLGFVRVEGAGISGVEWTARWNKIGSGTLSFQLWDETTSTELAVINDAAAAGDNRQQTETIIPGSPLAAGSHLLRVRAKSTVATDDPVYYGSSLRIRRVEQLYAESVHEVLILGESKIAPYDTAAALQARLGG
jgi:hypothetical protein